MQQLSVQENRQVRKNCFASVKRVGVVLAIASAITLVGPMSSALARTQEGPWIKLKSWSNPFEFAKYMIQAEDTSEQKAKNAANDFCRKHGWGKATHIMVVSSKVSDDMRSARRGLTHNCERNNNP